jgi:S-adenosylmethionine hydrolase
MSSSVSNVITLTTDFGYKDGYVGCLKGVILNIAPEVKIVDLCHEIRAFDVISASVVVANAYRYFPDGTIHVIVVDPGVGSSRRPILVKANKHYFVGPDNGVFSYILMNETNIKAYELTAQKFFADTISTTFHGRDIFSPVAAHLAAGREPREFGKAIDPETLVREKMPAVEVKGKRVTGYVVYIDGFGNLITNIPGKYVKKNSRLTLGKKLIGNLSLTYADVSPGQVAAFVASHGFVEIAAYKAKAKNLLKAAIGNKVYLEG